MIHVEAGAPQRAAGGIAEYSGYFNKAFADRFGPMFRYGVNSPLQVSRCVQKPPGSSVLNVTSRLVPGIGPLYSIIPRCNVSRIRIPKDDTPL